MKRRVTPEDFQSFNKDEDSDYNSYISREWTMFRQDSERYGSFLAEVGDSAGRVLDVGCGAGQEMLPFVDAGFRGVGLDYVPETGEIGSKLYAEVGHEGKVDFIRGSGDRLPFANSSFDVVISRGALMFMDNDEALSEFARVLADGGSLFLMFQAPPYYWWKLKTGLVTGKYLSAIHAARVLYGGTLFRISGRQPYGRLTAGGEVYETRRYVVETLKNHGLRLTGEMPDSNPQTPFLILKKGL